MKMVEDQTCESRVQGNEVKPQQGCHNFQHRDKPQEAGDGFQQADKKDGLSVERITDLRVQCAGE